MLRDIQVWEAAEDDPLFDASCAFESLVNQRVQEMPLCSGIPISVSKVASALQTSKSLGWLQCSSNMMNCSQAL